VPAGTFPLPLWLDESERRYRTVSTDVPLWTLRESDTPTLYNFIRKFYTLIRALN